MRKLAVQLIKELNSLSDSIPAGFKGFFAKSSGLFFRNSNNTEKQLATTDMIPSSLPANGGNADTLGGYPSSFFAKFDTAFTSFPNIPNNSANIHIYVIDDSSSNYGSNDLYQILTNDISDGSAKILILQPGNYRITSAIDCINLGVVGIIGLSRQETIISLECDSPLISISFIENLSLILNSDVSNPIITADASVNCSYVHNLIFTNNYRNKGAADFLCFYGFSSISNVVINEFARVAASCTNIINVSVLVTLAEIPASSQMFTSCNNITNIKINQNKSLSHFFDCTRISNFEIITESTRNVIGFEQCSIIENGSVFNLETAFKDCFLISNIKAVNCEYGFVNSAQISNCNVTGSVVSAFSICNKLSNNKAISSNIGFRDCNGIVNNLTDGCSTPYTNCFADMASSYPASDSPNGGWNS